MKKTLALSSILLVCALAWLLLFLFRPFLVLPEPAPGLDCVSADAGTFRPLGPPQRVFGIGLSYAGHIAESPGLYDPESGPPVFRKRPRSINRSDSVPYPSRQDLLAAADAVDPEHARRLSEQTESIPALLDYEVEIGLQIQRDFSVSELDDPQFVPPLGYFVSNDLTARILIGMAPSIDATVPYLAQGKSLAGFLPVGEQLFVPKNPGPNDWVCVDLVTRVNGEVRQQSSSRDIIYAPREILQIVARAEGLQEYRAGDWIVTGTPPGVALQTPGWVQRGLRLANPGASTKVAAMAGSADSGSFLHPGDHVTVSAGFLGEKTSKISSSRPETQPER